MLYYINLVFFYSLLGFVLESIVYKHNNTNAHSSIFTGPYTLVYGFGMLFCILCYEIGKGIISNTILSYFLFYFLFVFITSLTEWIGGHIIHYFLKIDKWNYENHKYHFGKYLCLTNSICWGFLALIIILVLHPFFTNNILANIPNYVTYIIIFIFLFDLLNLISKKIIKVF